MDDHSYSDFMSSTGFGGGSRSATPSQKQSHGGHVDTPSTKPMGAGEGQVRAQQFIGQYKSMEAPVAHKPHNSVARGSHEVQGVVSKQEYPSGPPSMPQLGGAALGAADARTAVKQDQGTWAAVGVGGNQFDPRLVKYENSEGEQPVSGTPVGYNNQAYAVGGVVCGVGMLFSLSKWNDAKRMGYTGSNYWGAAALLFALLAATAGYKYAHFGPSVEGQQGRVRIGTARLIPQGVLPRQRDQRDANPYPSPNDPMDTMGQRMINSGVETAALEGPRANYGYQRGPVTAEDRKRLGESELMRTARHHNMDKGTFDEYMARLDGEAPNQFYQAHPYMPFSAQWDKRSEIDDASNQFGISTSPGPANRKFKYKDPRMQQAGARTMHLKDPPPGSVPPLERTHPWLEHDASGEEPAVLLGSEVSNHEKLTAQDTSMFVKQRMAESETLESIQPTVDKEFLQTYEMDKKKPKELPLRPSFDPVGPPPNGPIDLDEERERMQNQTFEPVRYEQPPIQRDEPVDQSRKMYYQQQEQQPQEEYYQEPQYQQEPPSQARQVQSMNRQKMDHRVGDKAPPRSTPEDDFASSMLHSGFDGDDNTGGGGSFESMFAEKKQPSESDVKKAQMDQRRAQ